VPLVYRGEALGLLIAFDRAATSELFTADDERALQGFAASAATAVATAQSVQEQRLRDSLAAAEAERRRWSRELHDETLQALGGLRVLLWAARSGDDLDDYRAATDQAVEQLEYDIANLRAIISELRPASLDQLGLQPAIEMLVDRQSTVAGLEIACELVLPSSDRARTSLTPELDTTVYRIVQEALSNTVKHANASHVDLSIRAEHGEVVVDIRDDGVGFDVASPSEGFGLAGMRERVVLAGGTLSVESGKDAGTRICARFPLAMSRPTGDTNARSASASV
jgi:signal transduction histidine kinase